MRAEALRRAKDSAQLDCEGICEDLLRNQSGEHRQIEMTSRLFTTTLNLARHLVRRQMHCSTAPE